MGRASLCYRPVDFFRRAALVCLKTPDCAALGWYGTTVGGGNGGRFDKVPNGGMRSVDGEEVAGGGETGEDGETAGADDGDDGESPQDDEDSPSDSEESSAFLERGRHLRTDGIDARPPPGKGSAAAKDAARTALTDTLAKTEDLLSSIRMYKALPTGKRALVSSCDRDILWRLPKSQSEDANCVLLKTPLREVAQRKGKGLTKTSVAAPNHAALCDRSGLGGLGAETSSLSASSAAAAFLEEDARTLVHVAADARTEELGANSQEVDHVVADARTEGALVQQDASAETTTSERRVRRRRRPGVQGKWTCPAEYVTIHGHNVSSCADAIPVVPEEGASVLVPAEEGAAASAPSARATNASAERKNSSGNGRYATDASAERKNSSGRNATDASASDADEQGEVAENPIVKIATDHANAKKEGAAENPIVKIATDHAEKEGAAENPIVKIATDHAEKEGAAAHAHHASFLGEVVLRSPQASGNSSSVSRNNASAEKERAEQEVQDINNYGASKTAAKNALQNATVQTEKDYIKWWDIGPVTPEEKRAITKTNGAAGKPIFGPLAGKCELQSPNFRICDTKCKEHPDCRAVVFSTHRKTCRFLRANGPFRASSGPHAPIICSLVARRPPKQVREELATPCGKGFGKMTLTELLVPKSRSQIVLGRVSRLAKTLSALRSRAEDLDVTEVLTRINTSLQKLIQRLDEEAKKVEEQAWDVSSLVLTKKPVAPAFRLTLAKMAEGIGVLVRSVAVAAEDMSQQTDSSSEGDAQSLQEQRQVLGVLIERHLMLSRAGLEELKAEAELVEGGKNSSSLFQEVEAASSASTTTAVLAGMSTLARRGRGGTATTTTTTTTAGEGRRPRAPAARTNETSQSLERRIEDLKAERNRVGALQGVRSVAELAAFDLFDYDTAILRLRKIADTDPGISLFFPFSRASQ